MDVKQTTLHYWKKNTENNLLLSLSRFAGQSFYWYCLVLRVFTLAKCIQTAIAPFRSRTIPSFLWVVAASPEIWESVFEFSGGSPSCDSEFKICSNIVSCEKYRKEDFNVVSFHDHFLMHDHSTAQKKTASGRKHSVSVFPKYAQHISTRILFWEHTDICGSRPFDRLIGLRLGLDEDKGCGGRGWRKSWCVFL